jgi:hypothetical protein
MRSRVAGAAGIAAMVVVAGSCALHAPGVAMVETRLYLGAARPDGTLVDDAAWQAFLADVVTPRFPDGLTALDARGQWRDPRTGAIVREPSHVLIVVRPPGAATDAAVDAVATEWKRRFEQRSVLRVDAPVRAAY